MKLIADFGLLVHLADTFPLEFNTSNPNGYGVPARLKKKLGIQ